MGNEDLVNTIYKDESKEPLLKDTNSEVNNDKQKILSLNLDEKNEKKGNGESTNLDLENNNNK